MGFPLMQNVLFQKSAIAVQDLTDGSGYLNPVPAKRFMILGLPDTSFLRKCKFYAMESPEVHTDKLRWGTRVLRAGSQGVGLAEVEKAKPILSKQVLTCSLIKAQFSLTIDTLEDNIERAGFFQTLLDSMGPRIGLDMEELVLNGDVDNAVDPYLSLFDGAIKQADAITYNHLGGPISLDMFYKSIKLMPPEFQRALKGGASEYYGPWNLQHDWRANLAGRMGPVGDLYLQSMAEVGAFGIPLVPVVNMPDNKTYNGLSNHGDLLLTSARNNCVVGLYGGIRMFMDLDIQNGIWHVVLRFRMGFKLVEKTAAVKLRNIQCGASSQRIGGSSTAQLVPDDPAALSLLGFTAPQNNVEGYGTGVTTFVPPADLGLTAPAKFTP